MAASVRPPELVLKEVQHDVLPGVNSPAIAALLPQVRIAQSSQLLSPWPENAMRVLSRLFPVILILAASLAEAGSLAPSVRVVSERDRDFLERSGAQTLEELLDTGIVRYFFTGGEPLLVLVNGRPCATTASDLDTLPISAIERLQLLSGDGLGTRPCAEPSMSSCATPWTASRRAR